jgi:hypothetical protein
MTAPKLKAEIHTIGVPPEIKLTRPFWQKVGEIVAASTRRNILQQQQADGSRLKRNAPSTQTRKQEAGRPLLSLIDVGRRLVTKGAYIITPISHGVEIEPAARNIARWVQQKGYIGWLGVSRKAARALTQLVDQEIKRQIARASKKTTKRKLV